MTQATKVYSHTATSALEFNIYLSGVIGPAEDYIEELQVLREASPDDTVYIRINSDGGNVDTAVQYMYAIKNSQAKVVASLEGVCHSAATYVLLAADEWDINPQSFMLIHNYTAGAYGKGEDLVAQVLNQDSWVKDIMGEIYAGFLTEEEIKKVKANGDIYLRGSEITERLHKVLDLRQLAFEEEDRLRLEAARKQLDAYEKEEKTSC